MQCPPPPSLQTGTRGYGGLRERGEGGGRRGGEEGEGKKGRGRRGGEEGEGKKCERRWKWRLHDKGQPHLKLSTAYCEPLTAPEGK